MKLTPKEAKEYVSEMTNYILLDHLLKYNESLKIGDVPKELSNFYERCGYEIGKLELLNEAHKRFGFLVPILIRHQPANYLR